MTERITSSSATPGADPVDRAAFAARLTRAMGQAGHNRRSLAAAIGAHHNNVGQWASDTSWPRTDQLARLAIALNVSVDWLLTGRDPPLAHARGAEEANAPAVQVARDLAELGPQLTRLARRARKASSPP